MLLEPNEARVLLFFGNYRGTFYETGFWWVNPLMSAKKISMRARNLNVDPIKVNDKTGNPIMIGLVLVWRIKRDDIYKAVFEIDAASAGSTPGAAVSAGALRMFGSPVAGHSFPRRMRTSSLYLREISISVVPIRMRFGRYSSMCSVLTIQERWTRRNRRSSCASHCEMRVFVR